MKKLFKSKILNILLADAIFAFLALSAPGIAALMIDNISSCPFSEIGILCPTCGGTRCVQSFFNGDISKAFKYNEFITVFIFYVIAILVIANLYCLFDIKKLKGVLKTAAGYKAVIICAILFVVFGLIRAIVMF